MALLIKLFEENNDVISEKSNNNFTEDVVDISEKREVAINKWNSIVGGIETRSRDSNKLAIEFLESDDSEFLTKEDLIRCFDVASKIVKCVALDVFKGYDSLIIELINHPLCELDAQRILHVWNHSILKEFWNQRLNDSNIAFSIIRDEKYLSFLSAKDIENAWGNATTKVSPFGSNEVYLYSDWLAARIFENEKCISVLEKEGLINKEIIKNLCDTVKNSFKFSSKFSACLPAAILRSEKYQQLIKRDHVLEMWDKSTSRPESNFYGLDALARDLLNTPYSRQFLDEDKILYAWNKIVNYDEESGKINRINSDMLCATFLRDSMFKNYLIEKGILNNIIVELFDEALCFDSYNKRIYSLFVALSIVEDDDYRKVLLTDSDFDFKEIISFLKDLKKYYHKETCCIVGRAFFDLIDIVNHYFGNDD